MSSPAPPTSLLALVDLISLVEWRTCACLCDNAEVELDHDERKLLQRIAWLGQRRTAGAALTAAVAQLLTQTRG
jgi:hypothetical protein